MPYDTDAPDVEASTRKWMWAGVILMGLFFLMFPIYRLYEPAQRAEAREDQLGFLAATGEEIYRGECVTCHGPEGRGGLAPAVGSTNFLEQVDNDQIVQLIALGVPGTQMVAYSIDNGGPMTSEEIEAVAVYLRSLQEDAESNPFWQTPLAAEDLDGEDLYQLACANCHGVDREGIDDLGPDISADSLTMEESDSFLEGRIRDGYKEMPRFGRILTEGQIDAIVAYLRGDVITPEPPTTTTTVPGDGGTPGDTTTTTTTEPPDEGPGEEVLELGRTIFEVTAGGVGCAECHGLDGQGTADGPNIIGVSKSSIQNATEGGVPDMDNIDLTRDELDAVKAYLDTLIP